MNYDTDTILFDDSELFYDWKPYTDQVTGGLSTADVQQHDNYASFHGKIKPTSVGSWASLRSNKVERDLSAIKGVELKIRTDGRPFTFEMEFNPAWQDVKVGCKVYPKASMWSVIKLPLSHFEMIHLNNVVGNYVNDAVFSNIKRFNFFIAEKIKADFRLDICHIKFYS